MRHLSRVRRAALATAVVCALAGATSARAANLVPNPDFSKPCPGPDCGWVGAGAVLSQDPSAFSSSPASLSVTWDGSPMTVTHFARSACLGVTPGATYAFSFFYRFSSPAIAWVPGVIKLFTSTDCSGFPINPDQFALGTLRDGSWHQTGATVTAPITALSAYISMEGPCQTFPCASSPDPTIAFNVDDVVLEAAPVAVTFRGADARRTPVGVVVRWRTAAETGLLGFN